MVSTDEQDKMVQHLANRAADGCVRATPLPDGLRLLAQLDTGTFAESWTITPDGDARGITRASGMGFVTGGSSSELLTLEDVQAT